MPERRNKIPQSATPVARSGAGDISERELTRERHHLQSAPQGRLHPSHPKKQLFTSPVNKFTATPSGPSGNLSRIKTCLDRFSATPSRPVKVGPKAVSMEDLTPTKRMKTERKCDLPVVRASTGVSGVAEDEAAAKVARFMLLSAWRKRRYEVRCVRKTLEFQVTCSERLRLQVAALKSLLDSDNAKVRLAMREVERLNQLLRDKEAEKTVLEKEKMALEKDICAAEDRASEMAIGCRNSRNEAESARAASAATERTLALQRVAAAEARAQRDHALHALSEMENEMDRHEALLSSAEAEVAALKQEAKEKQQLLEHTRDELKNERMVRERSAEECVELQQRLDVGAAERAALAAHVLRLQADLARVQCHLDTVQEQLRWWPEPLTRMLGAARALFRNRMTVPEALLWSLVPARHGC